MFATISKVAVSWPRAVLACALAIMSICGWAGATVTQHLSVGGVATEAVLAENNAVAQAFPDANPNTVVLLTPVGNGRRIAVDDAAALKATQSVVDTVRDVDPDAAVRTWRELPLLRPTDASRPESSGLIAINFPGDDAAVLRCANNLIDKLPAVIDGVNLKVGGLGGMASDLTSRGTADMALTEGIALPLTLLALVIVFGSLVSAALPLSIGLFSIVTTLGILRGLATVTSVSNFALQLASALGLALAIDYSLLMVSRYREELAYGHDTVTAITRTIGTAGRTVMFSATTVAVALAALLVFPMYFLRSMAYTGIAVAMTAAAAAVIVLPAALVLLGPRIDKLDVRRYWRRTHSATTAKNGHWLTIARTVTKRPLHVTMLTAALLLLLGIPFLGLEIGQPDERALPQSAPSRVVAETIRADYYPGVMSSIAILLPGFTGDTSPYAAELSRVPGIDKVASPHGVYAAGTRLGGFPDTIGYMTKAGTGSYVVVFSAAEQYSSAANSQVRAVEAVHAPVPAKFAGAPILNVRAVETIEQRTPLALLFVAVATLVLLFLFTASIALPVKALVLNMLSLTATFGAMVWVFQDGHLQSLLGFTPTGYLNGGIPILMFCLAFGVSMDYEMFLLGRVREQWLLGERTRSGNIQAVQLGVARSGRIFTAAAGLMAIVFFAGTFSSVSLLQLFGLGMTLAVLIDATVIRLALAPALMTMMGTANWWLPRPLAALHRRFGISESSVEMAQTNKFARPAK